jgi:NTE family protein
VNQAQLPGKIGLALGGGGARGLAHIAMLEAFDEAGVRPAMIAGCSMGALVGAAYAAGLSAEEIRGHAAKLLTNRVDMLRHVFANEQVKPHELLSFNGLNSVLLSAEHLVRIALPPGVPERIEDLAIPMKIVATNYNAMSEHVFTEGLLVQAVAASIAIPGIISGTMIDGELHVDGGVTNPVPFNHLFGETDKIVAIDVTGRPRMTNGRHPSNIDVAIGSLLIMFHQIAKLRRAKNPPDLYFEPDVSSIGTGDFFRLSEILTATEPEKQKLLNQLRQLS